MTMTFIGFSAIIGNYVPRKRSRRQLRFGFQGVPLVAQLCVDTDEHVSLAVALLGVQELELALASLESGTQPIASTRDSRDCASCKFAQNGAKFAGLVARVLRQYHQK